ncbi:hypothetical protein ACT3TZ_01810 [Brachybacterium sp. AOP25-B2-12]|uniref:hypothetical protein n=1 Tax=Brachybacterium sp. AOP25-B2-12 TaxID=3457710 RepID=UPI004033B8BF
MTESHGFLPFGTPGGSPAPVDAPEGLEVARTADGGVLLARPRADAPALHLAVEADGVRWAVDLMALVEARRDAGQAPAPHHGTVLSYLRGDDVSSAPTTFYDGVLRVRAGDEVAVASDGTVTRTRPAPPVPSTGTPLARAVDAAVARTAALRPAVVVTGEDLASAALLASVDGAETAVTVHAGDTQARDAATEEVPPGRADAAAQAAGVPLQVVRLTTDRFKKDLADLVRAQAEPFAGLGVYAHYCAMRDAAHGVAAAPAVVLDATGPRGAGIIGASNLAGADARGDGPLAALRHAARRRTTRTLLADAVLDDAFLARTTTTGHLPVDPAVAPDGGAVLAARRNAERFGLTLALPLLDPEVGAVLALSAARAEHPGHHGPASPLAALAAPRAALTEPTRLAAIDQHAWLSRLKGTLHQVFRSEPFARRPWVDQRAVLEAFEAHVAGRTTGGDELFWRLLNLELWMRGCVEGTAADAAAAAAADADVIGDDDHGRLDEPDPKEPLAANAGKHLDISVQDAGGTVTARRYPVRTGKFSAESDMDREIRTAVSGFFAALDAALAADDGAPEHREATVGRPWNLTVSEKIIAIMQGRSYFVWDITPRWAAKQLSQRVARTPAGIGLGDPVTMELAIREAGLPRVVVAAAAGAIGKVLGRRGLFYEVVGGNVRAIDGPTEYSVYPANVSAKLPPADPDRVAAHLNDVIRAAVPAAWRDTFTGTVVMDANDIGRNTLGKAAPRDGGHYELQFADNPLGQGREQTPMAVVFER